MFTGIIETTGKVVSVKKERRNRIFTISVPFAAQLKTGQSVAHDGVCLTVEKIFASKKMYTVSAVKETLSRTNLEKLKVGDKINLERSLKAEDRLDGHFVQGHVDAKAKVKSIVHEKGSWLFTFEITHHPSPNTNLIVEKGSICVNGVSLTVVHTSRAKNNRVSFSVAVIPHTFRHTNFSLLKKGDTVNVEFDVLGKYISRLFFKRKKQRKNI